MLLEHGASVAVGDIDGRLLVHLAALNLQVKEKKDRVEALRYFLRKYPQLIDDSTRDSDDRQTTLHIAVANG